MKTQQADVKTYQSKMNEIDLTDRLDNEIESFLEYHHLPPRMIVMNKATWDKIVVESTTKRIISVMSWSGGKSYRGIKVVFSYDLEEGKFLM